MRCFLFREKEGSIKTIQPECIKKEAGIEKDRIIIGNGNDRWTEQVETEAGPSKKAKNIDIKEKVEEVLSG